MKRFLKCVISAAVAITAMTSAAVAQGGIKISGHVTSEVGAPIAGANVYLQGLTIGTQTGTDGSYSFTVGASYTTGQTATLTARVIGFTAKSVPVTLAAGKDITQDFTLTINPLRLSDVVITGAGTSTIRERLTTTVNTVDSSLILRHADPQNIVTALSASAPNVEVRTQSGDPGASASIKIRGASSVTGTNQPLFVIDGQPIDNSTLATTGTATSTDAATQGSLQGTVSPNGAADINPNDIESIEILKGSAAAAIYGARAANGVILITTKRGHAGAPRYNLSSTETMDNAEENIHPQMLYGQGSSGQAAQCTNLNTGDVGTLDCVPFAPSAASGSPAPATGAWGALIPAGTPVYDHATDIFRTGLTADNDFSVSGGDDKTTFYGSGGLTTQNGIVVGPNNKYNRLSVRLKGTQQVGPTLNLGANLNYIDTRGVYIQNGSNTSGLLLGSLRTPADYNNEDYITSTGAQRPYRFPNPSGDAALIAADLNTGYYDNPFWEAYTNNGNQSERGRFISNVNADWDPLSWLNVKYTLGADYYNDWRLQATPYTGATDPFGNVIRDDINNLEIDHNLVATATKSFSDNIEGTLTVGQNLNSRRQRGTFLTGEGLITPLPYILQNTTTFSDAENQSLQHIEAYFTQGELDLYKQLYLVVGLRDDGFSTFGASDRTALYPKASAAWNFTNALGNTDQKGWLSYGKLRLAYGETGKEPPLYASVGGYSLTNGIGSGFGDVNGTTQNGNGGVTSAITAPNPNLRPERQRELEGGTDLGFWDQKVDLSFTMYDKQSSDVIVAVPVSGAATGYQNAYENGATISNHGVELSLNARPYTSKNVAWDVGIQYGHNHGNVDNLLGAQFISYTNEGFAGAEGSSTVGYAPGVLRGQDFARCGRGLVLPVPGLAGGAPVSIDSLCAATPGGYKKGALFLAPNGQPITDPTDRVIADPNPKYTISYNTTLKLFNKVSISALVDARSGGQVADITRSAMDRFGTGIETEIRNVTDGQFGKNFLTSVYPNVAGPGTGVIAFASEEDWQNWFQGPGGSAGDTQYQFVENGSFVKLRELSLTYTMDQPFVRRYTGFSSAALRIAGRNLYTWTQYKGFDPEVNLQGAETLTQGLDFFSDPQTRSVVLSVSLNR